MGTAFGPVNVAIHTISASLKLGDVRTATEAGEALDLAALPSAWWAGAPRCASTWLARTP